MTVLQELTRLRDSLNLQIAALSATARRHELALGLSSPVELLDLAVRVENFFARYDIRTVADIYKFNREHGSRWKRGLGKCGIRVLNSRLTEAGLPCVGVTDEFAGTGIDDEAVMRGP